MARGRPRQFDIDEALENAMNVFWRKGYTAATIPELSRAMGVNRPSLYAAFGSKEELFRRVLDRYRAGPASYVSRAVERETAVEVFTGLMTGVVDLVTDPDRPGGCLFVCAGLASDDETRSVTDELAARRIAGEEDIRVRFEKAKADGDLPGDAEPAALAKFTAAMIWGIAVQAASGSRRSELMNVADLATAAFAKMPAS